MTWEYEVHRRAREVMREWRAKEAKAAEGRLRDLKRRVDNRLAWYQRDKPVRKEQMAKFVVERYEVHAQKVMVEAFDRVDAVIKVLAGEGIDLSNGLDYIESDENRGMPLSLFSKSEIDRLARAVGIADGRVVTIRSVEEE